MVKGLYSKEQCYWNSRSFNGRENEQNHAKKNWNDLRLLETFLGWNFILTWSVLYLCICCYCMKFIYLTYELRRIRAWHSQLLMLLKTWKILKNSGYYCVVGLTVNWFSTVLVMRRLRFTSPVHACIFRDFLAKSIKKPQDLNFCPRWISRRCFPPEN